MKIQDIIAENRAGVRKGRLNELAPGGSSGNGPFDYGAAIVKIGEDFLDHFTDPQAGEDAAQITKAGETFIEKGMLAGVKFLYQELDTQVRDHVFDELVDQGFNVDQDLIALRKQIPRDPEAGGMFAKAQADWQAQPGDTYVVTGQWGKASSTSQDIKASSEEEAEQKFLASNQGTKFNSIDVKRRGGAAGVSEATIKRRFDEEDLLEFTGDEMQYATTPASTAANDPERLVGVLMFGRFGKTDPWARTAWAALQRELPQEYPNKDAAATKIAEIARDGGAIVTEKPRPEAERLIKRFQAYGLKSRIVDDNLREQNTALSRRMPRIGDTLQWRTMQDKTTRTGTVLDIKGFDVTVKPKRLPGETVYPRPMGVNLANKQLTYRVIPAELSMTQPGGWTPQTPLEADNRGMEEAVDPGRRRILAGLAGFAAVSAMPTSLVSALSTPEGIRGMSVSDVSALLKAIRAYLPPYDQEDWTGTFERWDKMAEALRIPDGDLDAADKLDRLMRQYRRDPEAASAKLLRHLQRHAVDLTDVRGQTISQWDDVDTVRRSDPVNDEIRQMQQQIADYNARMQRGQTPGIGQTQTAAAAATSFRDLLQRVMSAGSAMAAPPRERYMGRIEPTASTLALPAPDRTAAEIMRDLQIRLGRTLTDQEQQIVRQELGTQKQSVAEGENLELYGLRIGDTVTTKINSQRVQGDIIDIYPEDMEVELLLRGPEAGRTVVVDVRNTEIVENQFVAEGRRR